MDPKNILLSFVILLLSPVEGVLAQDLSSAASKEVDFSADVRPLLAKHCWLCHGSNKQESGLRLDGRAVMLQGGDQGPAVIVGESAKSRLMLYVAGTDPDRVMPPEGPRLTAEQIGILRAWIDQGAKWPDSEKPDAKGNQHWAYQPLKTSQAPSVSNTAWPKNTIDQFVLSKLEEHQRAPSTEASRYTIIRRLTLDLTGLLPSVTEVDQFVNDQQPAAYDLLVDRLLASPHFGERWGRHWLDMARYADSDGYEKDNPRPDAYRWRDWVIDAINVDMPFDQFTMEQLAGDLLPNATTMQQLATAFHRQTLTNTEGGTDQEQFRVEACFDRTETTGTIWLGLTVGCARCHTHKYDAITQREYYQLFSVFNNGDEATAVVPKSAAEIAFYETAKSAHDAAVGDVTGRLLAAQQEQTSAFQLWQKTTLEDLATAAAHPVKLMPLRKSEYSSEQGITFTPQKGGTVLVGGDNPDLATYTVTARAPKAEFNGLRLDVLADKSLPANGPGRVAHGNFVLSELTLEVASMADFSDAHAIEFVSGRADFEQKDRPWLAMNVIDGNTETGWAIAPEFGKDHWLVLSLKEPLKVSDSQFVRIRLSHQHGQQHTIGRFRLSLQTGVEPAISVPSNIQQALNVAADIRTTEQNQQLLAAEQNTISEYYLPLVAVKF